MKWFISFQMYLYKWLSKFSGQCRNYWSRKEDYYGRKYVSMLKVDWKLELYEDNPFE